MSSFFLYSHMISLTLALFSVCLMAIMYTVLKSERKQSHCFALEILSDEFCAARTIHSSYSFTFGCTLAVFSFITSILWLSLQEKQRKFAQHWYEQIETQYRFVSTTTTMTMTNKAKYSKTNWKHKIHVIVPVLKLFTNKFFELKKSSFTNIGERIRSSSLSVIIINIFNFHKTTEKKCN